MVTYSPGALFNSIAFRVNKYLIWPWQHRAVVRRHRERFMGKQPTIISCNCTGGVLYHDLGLVFTSPTINLYMSSADFMSFCERLEHYLSLPLVPMESHDKPYPLAALGELILHCVHYRSFQEAARKWEERKKRMDMNNVFILATDRDGFHEEIFQRFIRLPYRKKLFSHCPLNHPDVFHIKGYENDSQIGDLMQEVWGGTRVIDQFDWVHWLNGE